MNLNLNVRIACEQYWHIKETVANEINERNHEKYGDDIMNYEFTIEDDPRETAAFDHAVEVAEKELGVNHRSALAIAFDYPDTDAAGIAWGVKYTQHDGRTTIAWFRMLTDAHEAFLNFAHSKDAKLGDNMFLVGIKPNWEKMEEMDAFLSLESRRLYLNPFPENGAEPIEIKEWHEAVNVYAIATAIAQADGTVFAKVMDGRASELRETILAEMAVFEKVPSKKDFDEDSGEVFSLWENEIEDLQPGDVIEVGIEEEPHKVVNIYPGGKDVWIECESLVTGNSDGLIVDENGWGKTVFKKVKNPAL